MKKRAIVPDFSSKAGAPEICFYRANEKPYGVFSNLYLRNIIFEGRIYASAEHAYQAGKARKEAVREWLLSAPSPSLVAMAAHGLYTWDIVPNWASIKFTRMRQVLQAKFTQHDDLREILLSTGNRRLVESATVANSINRLWGEVNGKGQNMLGTLLMEIRGELQKSPSKKGGTKRKINGATVDKEDTTHAESNLRYAILKTG
jgi:ribA/ribD-fused uncharacterized protein